MQTKEKLSALREQMKQNDLNAFIVYSADPHMSEYLPEEWLERAWLSGFTGSAGFVVVTLDKAALWTDSRYFVQAPIELKDSGIELMNGMDNTPDYIDWIKSEVPQGGKVGVNAIATAHANWEKLKNNFSDKNIELIDKPLIEKIWVNKGVSPKNKVFIQPEKWAGKSVKDKLNSIREKMQENNASAHIITALDDVAWTLNLRGSDVDYNPVFMGYIYLSNQTAILFVDEEKVNDEVKNHLSAAGVEVKPYLSFFDFLKTVKGERILISPLSNQSIYDVLDSENTFIEKAPPGNLMKAIKNENELAGFRTVMERDGVAMVKFLYWLKHSAANEGYDEFMIGEKLKGFRAEGENFVGESFGSIIGYKGNGAIVHYSAKKEGCKKIENDGSVLVDSGGQYLEGTTDITRTVVLGKVTHEFKKNCTLVLKGMIDLSMVKFPKGTRGVQLDAFARMPLWMENKDYGHGTGHGVGCFMNVHEGPQNIRKDLNPQVLIPGMVLSNEPGFYVENEYGIRHENLVAVKESAVSDFGTFYEFETLTFCPFMVDSILPDLLTDPQKKWLNSYQQQCKEKIEPHLEGDVKNWFLELVKPI